MVENWKLTFYQRTLSRSERLEEINRNFSKLKGKPYEFEKHFESEPAPLFALEAEKIAQEAEKQGAVSAKKQANLSEASIYCGESSFGFAPKVEISAEDTKQRLLNAERYVQYLSTTTMAAEV